MNYWPHRDFLSAFDAGNWFSAAFWCASARRFHHSALTLSSDDARFNAFAKTFITLDATKYRDSTGMHRPDGRSVRHERLTPGKPRDNQCLRRRNHALG
jgi:hypothetical protein